MQITLQSHAHPYGVESAPTLKEAVERACAGRKTYALVDARVQSLYASELTALAPERTLALEATEEQKSFGALEPVFRWMLSSGFRKDADLLVIGGGVIQDIGGFVATVLFRGVRWRLIPTTLLAQCDSCIGSKSSINVGEMKNQLGTFYPPNQIYLVASVLRTLPPEQLHSGIGEMIKLALIAGPEAWASLRSQLAAYESSGQLNDLEAIVLDSLLIKKRYIEEDEFDRGPRNLLNYGHTFGHAYESATAYGIPHGIAVLMGVSTATWVSEALGMVPKGYFASLDRALSVYYRAFSPQLRSAGIEQIRAAMRLDKKNTGGRIGCILTRGEGRMERASLAAEELFPLVERYLAQS